MRRCPRGRPCGAQRRQVPARKSGRRQVSRLTKLAQDPPPVEGIRHRLLPLQTLRQPCELESGGIRFPNHSSIIRNTNNRPGGAPAQRLHTIPRGELSGLAKRLDNGNHGVAIQNTGDVVGDSGGEFPLSNRCKVAKQSQRQFPPDERKFIPIQKEEWSAPMKIPKEIKYLDKG